MKCYVINLDRAPNRWTWMQGQAEAIGITLTRVTAIDGKDLSEQEFRSWTAPAFDKYTIGKNEIACYLSHRSAWEKIAEGDDPYAVVFEDDVHFGDNIADFLTSTDWIPADADLVRLETFATFLAAYQTRPAHHAHGRTLHRLRGLHLGLAGCIISRRAARFLLDNVSAIGNAVDQIVFDPKSAVWKDLTRYQIIPAPVVQNTMLPEAEQLPDFPSHLQEERVELNWRIFNQHRRDMNRIKPRGFAKLQRELWRPTMQFRKWLSRIYRRPFGIANEHIPFR